MVLASVWQHLTQGPGSAGSPGPPTAPRRGSGRPAKPPAHAAGLIAAGDIVAHPIGYTATASHRQQCSAGHIFQLRGAPRKTLAGTAARHIAALTTASGARPRPATSPPAQRPQHWRLELSQLCTIRACIAALAQYLPARPHAANPHLLWGRRIGGGCSSGNGRRQQARAVALDRAPLREDARHEVLVRVLQAPVVNGFLWQAGHMTGASACQQIPGVAKSVVMCKV